MTRLRSLHPRGETRRSALCCLSLERKLIETALLERAALFWPSIWKKKTGEYHIRQERTVKVSGFALDRERNWVPRALLSAAHERRCAITNILTSRPSFPDRAALA